MESTAAGTGVAAVRPCGHGALAFRHENLGWLTLVAALALSGGSERLAELPVQHCPVPLGQGSGARVATDPRARVARLGGQSDCVRRAASLDLAVTAEIGMLAMCALWSVLELHPGGIRASYQL
jgi:hypothetical protein